MLGGEQEVILSGVEGGKRTKKKYYIHTPSGVLRIGCGPASLIICRAHVCLRARVTAALSAPAGVVSHIFKYPSARRVRRNSALTTLPLLSRGGRGEHEKVTCGRNKERLFFWSMATNETDANSQKGRASRKRVCGTT